VRDDGDGGQSIAMLAEGAAHVKDASSRIAVGEDVLAEAKGHSVTSSFYK
jgi:hypothetical protein